MDSLQDDDEILIEIPYYIRVYKDGRFIKLSGTDVVPAGIDPLTGVQSKDVVISPETNVFVRIYIPKTTKLKKKKLPFIIYYHGGGFIIETAASPTYHNFLNLVSSESNAVIVSVDYRKAPEHFVPTCYDDAWEAIKWVAEHADGNGPDPWLNEYPEFSQVFLMGDSAGANITHNMAIRVGLENPSRVISPNGIVLLHPYFWGEERIGSESGNPWVEITKIKWVFAYPGTTGLDDPLLNPDKDPKVSDLGSPRVLVFVAENDLLKDRGWFYKDILAKNEWKGDIEVIEDESEDHVYFLRNLSADNSRTLRKKISTFINHISE